MKTRGKKIKLERTSSEQRFYDLLVKMDIKPDSIQEHDQLGADEKGTADFFFENIVFEVKEALPSPQKQEEIKDDIRALRSGKTITYQAPSVYSSFHKDLKLAREKFKPYKDCATVLVEDFTRWGIHEPDIEELIFGKQIIRLDDNPTEDAEITYGDRLFRTDKNRSIGCLCIITAGNILVYHNIMAHQHRLLPLSFMVKLQKVKAIQYLLMNIPGGPPHIRNLT